MSFDGYRVKTSSNATVYVVINNQKRAIPDMTTFNNLFDNTTDIQVVTQAQLNSISPGATLTSGAVLAKGSGATVYLITNNQRLPIMSMETVDKYDFDINKVVTTPDVILNLIAQGAVIS